MAAAVGMKPGEKPTYVAGPGYVPSGDDPDANADGRALADKVFASRNAAARAGGGTGSAGGSSSGTPGADAGGGTAVNDGAGRISPTNSDHGAGFYWHVVQPY